MQLAANNFLSLRHMIDLLFPSGDEAQLLKPKLHRAGADAQAHRLVYNALHSLAKSASVWLQPRQKLLTSFTSRMTDDIAFMCLHAWPIAINWFCCLYRHVRGILPSLRVYVRWACMYVCQACVCLGEKSCSGDEVRFLTKIFQYLTFNSNFQDLWGGVR